MWKTFIMQNLTIQYSTLAFEIKRFLKARHFVRIHDKKKFKKKNTPAVIT